MENARTHIALQLELEGKEHTNHKWQCHISIILSPLRCSRLVKEGGVVDNIY